MKVRTKNLVLGVVGDHSVHQTWIDGADRREFDLCLVYFGEHSGRYESDAEYYYQQRGIKFSLIHRLIHEGLGEVVSKYDRVWTPDDDIAATTKQINRLFRIAKTYHLQLAQPAIGEGDVSYLALRHHPGYLLRYTQFVEMMCPLFTLEAFSQVLPLFAENASGWGLDWVWSSMFPRECVAVIDGVAVVHTRPMASGGVHARFSSMGINPSEEGREMRKKHGVRNTRFRKAIHNDTARLRAIADDGRKAWTRPLWPGWKLKRAA